MSNDVTEQKCQQYSFRLGMLGGIGVRLPSVLGGGVVTILPTLKLVNVEMKKDAHKIDSKATMAYIFQTKLVLSPLTKQAQGALTRTSDMNKT